MRDTEVKLTEEDRELLYGFCILETIQRNNNGLRKGLEEFLKKEGLIS